VGELTNLINSLTLSIFIFLPRVITKKGVKGAESLASGDG